MVALGHENVGGLNVAMNNASRVRRIQRVRDLDTQRQDRFQLHRTVADHVLECSARQKFHDQERAAFLLANVINRADVGMVQSRSRLGFTAKALQRLPVLCQVVGKKLERDKAAQPRVLGFVDDAHTAAAQLLNDPVM